MKLSSPDRGLVQGPFPVTRAFAWFSLGHKDILLMNDRARTSPASPFDPLVGLIVCNARAMPHPTPAGPWAAAARPTGLQRPIISLLLTQTTWQSPSHITPVLPCTPVSLRLPRFPSLSGPPRCLQGQMHTGAREYFFSFRAGRILSVLLTFSTYQQRQPLTMMPQGTTVAGECEGG